jgi:phosphate transport system permease protein
MKSAPKIELRSSKSNRFSQWWSTGTPWIWLNAGAVSASIVAVFGLLFMIAAKGMGHFWPTNIHHFDYVTKTDTIALVGEFIEYTHVDRKLYEESGLGKAPAGDEFVKRWLFKTGNRDILSADFRWLDDFRIENKSQPENLVVVERTEWGNFYGYLQQVNEAGVKLDPQGNVWQQLETRIERVVALREQIHRLERDDIGAINHQLERLRLKRRSHELDATDTKENLAEIAAQEKSLDKDYEVLRQQLVKLNKQITRDTAHFKVMSGESIEIKLAVVVSVLQPNRLNLLEKTIRYFSNFKNFVLDNPRESNTEGGVFPAIFGTVVMVLLMTVLVTPLGVVAAVYLREYAKQGATTRLIRIAVNNLAGVPSIVYGVFGLGFFVYFLGGNIDQLFFPEALPAPTFGTPGLMWASLTLALLTLPVVIVSTEEGLARVPKSFREGSLALGASKFETLWKVVLPMASPSIMTGLILAVARAAGEVAPLMMVGVVKLAPQLPVDLNAPFIHLDRKFMHLGFHIFDVGFQSPNVEAARPMVYATAFLLVLVIVLLNLTAIILRNRLRERFKALDS